MTIEVQGGKLAFRGPPPYEDVEMSVPFVKAALCLPPISPVPSAKTLSYLLANISPAAAVRFRRLVELTRETDPDVYDLFRHYEYHIAGVAEPGATNWPLPAPDNVLESLKFSLPPLEGAICTTSGRLFLCTNERLMTAVEFELLHGVSLTRYVADAARRQAAGLRRLILLADSGQHTVEITYQTIDGAVGTRELRVCSMDQLDSWAAARALTIISTEKLNAN